MQKRQRGVYLTISVAASALLGLYLAQAPTVVHADPVQTTTVQTNQNPQVTAYDDYNSNPNKDTWQDPSKYPNTVPVQILGINDVHGNIDTTGNAYVGAHSYKNAGNAARLASYLKEAQDYFDQQNKFPQGNNNIFRVEAGDAVGASPAMSSLLQDEPTLKALKAMGITIGTLGNHEFDEGLTEFNRALTGGKPKPGQFNPVEMKYPHENSDIQMVVSNVTTDDGKTPFNWSPYLVKEIKYDDKTVKVGFIGVVTTDMPKLTFAKNLKGYKILDPAETIAKYEKILRAQRVNAIVVLGHTAVFNKYDKKTKTNIIYGESIDILKKLYQIDPDNSVDIFIGAHSHWYANGQVGHTKIVQAESYSKAYDDITGYIDPKTDDFVPGSLLSHVYPVMSETQDPVTKGDKKVEAIIKDAEERTKAITEAPIGHGAKIVSKAEKEDGHESEIADLVVDAQLAMAKKNGIKADFAITNAGGVRASLNVEPNGDILWKSAQAVQPFGNRLQVNAMTGQQIANLMNSQGGSRWYLVAGMKYYSTKTNDKDHPDKTVLMLDSAGQPVEMDKTYNVVVNNYLADSVPELKDTKKVADLGVDTDIFIDYIKGQKEIMPPKTDRKETVTAVQAAQLLAKYQNNTQPGDTTSANDSSTDNNAVKPAVSQEVYLPIINNKAKWQIRLMDEQGHFVDGYLKTNRAIKVDQEKTVHGLTIYHIAGTNFWLPKMYTANQQEQKMSGVAHMPILSRHPRWKVRLLDANGHYTNQYLRTNTNWKVFGRKMIRGQLMYRLGTQQQWCPAVYLRLR